MACCCYNTYVTSHNAITILQLSHLCFYYKTKGVTTQASIHVMLFNDKIGGALILCYCIVTFYVINYGGARSY